MGCCKTRIHPRDAPPQPKQQLAQNLPQQSQIKIANVHESEFQQKQQNFEIKQKQQKFHSIFKNHSCPIDNQILQDINNELGQFVIPSEYIQGIHSQTWKEVYIKENYSNWWYTGQWKNQQMHGKGYLYNKRKQMLINGLFLQNKILKDKCRIIFQSGAYYVGPINQFYQPNGFGEMIFNDGSKYVGQFLSGIPHKNSEENKDENYSAKSVKNDNNTPKYRNLKLKARYSESLIEKNLNVQNRSMVHKKARKFSPNKLSSISMVSSRRTPKKKNHSPCYSPESSGFLLT